MAFGNLKKWFAGATAQVNPFDGGKDFRSVTQGQPLRIDPYNTPGLQTPAPAQPAFPQGVSFPQQPLDINPYRTPGLDTYIPEMGTPQPLQINPYQTPGLSTYQQIPGLDFYDRYR